MLKLSVSNSAQMSLQFRFRERLEPFKAHLPEAAERVIEEELGTTGRYPGLSAFSSITR